MNPKYKRAYRAFRKAWGFTARPWWLHRARNRAWIKALSWALIDHEMLIIELKGKGMDD